MRVLATSPCRAWPELDGRRTGLPWFRRCAGGRRMTTTTSHPGSQRVVSSLSRPTDPAETTNCDQSSSEVSQ